MEGVAADPSYRLSVTVKGPVPPDSAPNPLAMFLVAIWEQIAPSKYDSAGSSGY